jgi:hypothetical protein
VKIIWLVDVLWCEILFALNAAIWWQGPVLL